MWVVYVTLQPGGTGKSLALCDCKAPMQGAALLVHAGALLITRGQ
jgi:hypothetical protein